MSKLKDFMYDVYEYCSEEEIKSLDFQHLFKLVEERKNPFNN